MINTDDLEKKMMELLKKRYREGWIDAVDMVISAFNTPSMHNAALNKGEIVRILKHARLKVESNLQENNNDQV